MRKLLIAVIILAGLLVAADRVGAVVASREIASRVQAAYSLPSKPSVTVRGFPFLTQVASGDYHEIDVSMPSLSADGVQVNALTARLTGVRAPLRDLDVIRVTAPWPETPRPGGCRRRRQKIAGVW